MSGAAHCSLMPFPSVRSLFGVTVGAIPAHPGTGAEREKTHGTFQRRKSRASNQVLMNSAGIRKSVVR